LSTFVGGFDLVAAEGVCAPADDSRAVADILANLVDKSMVQIVDREATRYRILETLREFGSEKLDTLGIADAVRARHTEWYVTHAEEWAAGLGGHDEAASASSLERDFENCREAHATALARGDADHAIRIVCALREFAFRRMQYEVTAWADATLALPDAEAHRLAPVPVAGTADGAVGGGDLDPAHVLGERAGEIGERHGATSSGLAERAIGNARF